VTDDTTLVSLIDFRRLPVPVAAKTDCASHLGRVTEEIC
jgi:hypothetical protein